jgi:hypothetical protein
MMQKFTQQESLFKKRLLLGLLGLASDSGHIGEETANN